MAFRLHTPLLELLKENDTLTCFISCLFVLNIIILSNQIHVAEGTLANDNKLFYGCIAASVDDFHCDLMPNIFRSSVVSGEVEKIYEISAYSPDLVQGKFGKALDLEGYTGQYLTIPNKSALNQKIFSISFWMVQDPSFALEGSVLSHVNTNNTSGWFVKANPVEPGSQVEFSVVNNLGKIFTTTTPIRKGTFENIVGTFDGTTVKVYLNGVLKDSASFSGTYQPDPGVPLNIGLNSYNLDKAWKGTIDEVRLFNRILSPNEIEALFRGNHNRLEGVAAYWPFDNGTNDLSSTGNDGRIASQAVSMAFVPDGRLFFTEKNLGDIRIIREDHLLPKSFVHINHVFVAQHQGLLGIAVDRKFVSNHFIYAYYTSRDNETGVVFNRVVRFTESNNEAIAEKILLDKIPASPDGEFAGGAIAFGPDDKLYITTGHANSYELPQDNSSLIGKVLRLNRDGTIPSDNPFPNSPIYTVGHRNIFGIAFDKNGTGFMTENGESHYDEINILKGGGNYGFPTTQPPTRSPLSDNSSSIKPIRYYWSALAPTQAIFYDGEKFKVVNDKFLFGSYNEGSIYAIGLNKSHAVADEMAISFPSIVENIISLAQSPRGDIYFGGYNIYKLKSISAAEQKQGTYFVELSAHRTEVEKLSFDSNTTSMALTVTTDLHTSPSSPFIKVNIPKKLLNGIFDVISSTAGNSVKDFAINQEYRTANIGDTILDIQLNEGIKDTILIRGTGPNQTN